MSVHLLFHFVVFLTQNRLQKAPTMTEFGYLWQFSCVQVQHYVWAQASTIFKITQCSLKLSFCCTRKQYSCRHFHSMTCRARSLWHHWQRV